MSFPAIPADAPATMQGIIDANIAAQGGTFVIRETGEEFRALSRFLAQDDMPDIAPEGVGNNTNEMNPLSLYAVERTAELRPEMNVYFKDSADPLKENYIVETVDSVFRGAANTEVRRYALLYRSPIFQ